MKSRSPAPDDHRRVVRDARLDLVLEAGGMGTWEWDLRADRLHWDARTAAMFGIDLADFDGTFEMFEQLVHPDDMDALGAAIQQAIATRGEFRREYRVRHGNGDIRWVSVRGRVIVDDTATPTAMLGVIQDRTDSHSLGEQLTRTLESIDEAFFSLDARWRFSYVNARAEELLQRSRAELLGGCLWELFPDAVGSTFEERYRTVMEQRIPVTFEERYPPLDIWVEVRAYPDTEGIAVYFRDVSERRAREEARQERLARQERAHQAAARLLDRASRLRVDHTPEQAAATACDVGVEVLACAHASLWQVRGGGAVLLASSSGAGRDAKSVGIDDAGGWRAAVRDDEPTFVADATAVRSPVERDIAAQLGVRSMLLVPVRLSERAGTLLILLGWKHVIETPDRQLTDVAHRFAQQAALALEQARHRQVQDEVTELSAQLQASLLPAPNPAATELEIASLYRPGERRMVLGGDFYDVVGQPDGCLALVIGDVTGHGPEAAAIGASLRAGWRALALGGASAADAIGALDALLRSERDSDEQLVSVCCAQISPDRSAITVASAGHPPPIAMCMEGATPLDPPTGMLLGLPVSDVRWDAVTQSLPPPWGLLLYTDGLVEARLHRGSSERLGLERFVEQVAAAAPLDTPSLDAALGTLQRTIRMRSGQPIEDDVALLLVRHGTPRRATTPDHS